MDSLIKGIIRRNEILTLLSTLQAAGLNLTQLLRYMAPIVYDIFDEKAKVGCPVNFLISNFQISNFQNIEFSKFSNFRVSNFQIFELNFC